jgi:glycerol-3-phosphate dehydrogenase (NAD(P)+)
MAREHKVEMPISSAVAAMLADKMSVDEAIESLLARPLRSEE